MYTATKVSPSVTATKTSPTQPTQDLSPNSKDTDYGQGKGKPNLRVVIPPKSEVRMQFELKRAGGFSLCIETNFDENGTIGFEYEYF